MLPEPPTVVEGIEEAVCGRALSVEVDIPIPILASWEELAIAIGKVGLC